MRALRCPLWVKSRRKTAPILMSAFGGKADVNQLATGDAFEGIDFGGWGTPSGVCPLPDRRKLIWRFLNLVPPQIQIRP